MPTYRCTASRRIADNSYQAGLEYELEADVAQRYAGYFQIVSVGSQAPIMASEYEQPSETTDAPGEGAESAPKRRGRRF
jgi:hypothetical protein